MTQFSQTNLYCIQLVWIMITCTWLHVIIFHLMTPKWIMVLTFIVIDVSSFIVQGSYWWPDAKGTSWLKLLCLYQFSRTTGIKAFPFDNHNFLKKLNISSLSRPTQQTNKTPFIEVFKPKMQPEKIILFDNCQILKL